MRGRYGHRLIADCPNPLVYVCEPFKVASVHIMHSTPDAYPYYYGFAGCGINPSYTSLETSKWPHPKTQGPPGYLYGRTPTSTIREIPNNPSTMEGVDRVYFYEADLVKWRQRRACPTFTSPPPGREDFPPCFISGPACTGLQTVHAIRRRVIGEPEYENYLQWYFTDPDNLLENCCHDDWLGYTYPAKWIWHNKGIEQPFNAWDFWEDTGVDPVKVSTSWFLDLLPFCTPLNGYTVGGTYLGQYIGYTHMVFLNNNIYMCGNNPEGGGLPEDPTIDPTDPPTYVKRYQDAMSIDVHWYMVGTGYLKSPRLGSMRFWRPNTATGYVNSVMGKSSCSPYLYFDCGNNFLDDWGINVRYHYVGDTGSEVIAHGLSATKVYVVA